MKEKISCFICLMDIYRPKKAELPCECKPYLHQRCLNLWFKHNENKCPICRIDYEDYGIDPIVQIEQLERLVRYKRYAKKFTLILIFSGLFFSIATLLIHMIGYMIFV